MSPKSKFLGIFAGIATLTTIFMFLFNVKGTKDMAWRFFKPELIEQNADLKNENEWLTRKMADLTKQNLSLRKYLDAYEKNFIELKDAAGNAGKLESLLSFDLPEELIKERFEIRQHYRQMRSEKKRWDQHQQEQYKDILESTVEPIVIESQSLNLEDEENMEYFLELESALKLHRRLIRDVRLFHDEINFQTKQLDAQQPYALYDLKFKLNDPFARDSALVDALQQAMSALSAGIYEQEAVEVLDRIGDEFTKPIQKLYEQQLDTSEFPVQFKYNYNFYTVFGKKLMDYSDSLAQQSAIPLESSAFGELDFFNRRMSESLYELFRVGQDEAINPNYLDLDELQQILQTKH